MAILDTLKKVTPQTIWSILGGRSFLIVTFFAVSGFILALHGKLTADYAGLATALAGWHIGRAISQDRNGQ